MLIVFLFFMHRMNLRVFHNNFRKPPQNMIAQLPVNCNAFPPIPQFHRAAPGHSPYTYSLSSSAGKVLPYTIIIALWRTKIHSILHIYSKVSYHTESFHTNLGATYFLCVLYTTHSSQFTFQPIAPPRFFTYPLVCPPTSTIPCR